MLLSSPMRLVLRFSLSGVSRALECFTRPRRLASSLYNVPVLRRSSTSRRLFSFVSTMHDALAKSSALAARFTRETQPERMRSIAQSAKAKAFTTLSKMNKNTFNSRVRATRTARRECIAPATLAHGDECAGPIERLPTSETLFHRAARSSTAIKARCSSCLPKACSAHACITC